MISPALLPEESADALGAGEGSEKVHLPEAPAILVAHSTSFSRLRLAPFASVCLCI